MGYGTTIVKYGHPIFSFETESSWKHLEEALNLLVSVSNVKLLSSNMFDGIESEYPNRFIDIISRVFQKVSELYAEVPLHILFPLCQSWPSLTILDTETEFWSCRPIDPPPDAFPQLREVKSSLEVIRRVVAGRSIRTIIHTGPSCGILDDERPNDFNILKATLKGCTTLRKAVVQCHASREDESAALLPEFAHGNLREFKLFIAIDQSPHTLRLTPSLVLQGLPPGAPIHFPQLELLVIYLLHDTFASLQRVDVNDNAIANALSAYLASEVHPTLRQVVVGLRGMDYSWGVRFVATRTGNHWDVQIPE